MRTLTIIVLAFLIACGGSSGGLQSDPNLNTNKTILASNVILRSAVSGLIKSANAEDIDTTTKVLAGNVIIDNSALGVESNNVQDALEEVVPQLSTLVVKQWNIKTLSNGLNNGSENGVKNSGTITFNDDLTFILNGIENSDGSFVNSLIAELNRINNATTTYEIIDNLFIRLAMSGQRKSDGGQETFSVILAIFNTSSAKMSAGDANAFYILTAN